MANESSFDRLQYHESGSARWRDPHTGMLVDVVFDADDRIDYIALSPSVGRGVEGKRQGNLLDLKDIFECLGVPERYSANVTFVHDLEPGFNLSLIYPKLGLIVYSVSGVYESKSDFGLGCEVDVTPDIRVTTVYLADPETVARQLESFEKLRLPVLADLRFTRPWGLPGFGTVKLAWCFGR